MQPVGQLAQVEELHLEAGDKGASHPEGCREAPTGARQARGGVGARARRCEELGREEGMERRGDGELHARAQDTAPHTRPCTWRDMGSP